MRFVPASIPKKVFAVLSLAILLCYLILSFSRFLISEVDTLDEAIPLTGALLISRGFVPHMDFWSMYTPLNYYLISFAFSLLGPSVVSARILQGCLYVLVVIVLFLGFRALLSQGRLFILNLVLISSILIANAFTYVWWNAYALAFLGLWLYLFGLQNRGRQPVFLIASGFLIGLACLAKLNFGSYAVLGVFIGLAIDTWRNRSRGIRNLLFFLLPVSLCFLAYLIPYGFAAMEVVNQILIYPSQGLEQHRILTLPDGLNRYGSLISAVFPLIWMGLRSVERNLSWDRCALFAFSSSAFCLAALFVIGTHDQRLLPKFFLITTTILILLEIVFSRLENGEFTILLVYSLFTNYFLSRMDAGHFTVLVPLAVILLPYLLQNHQVLKGQNFGRMARFSAGVLVIALCSSPAVWHLKVILSHPGDHLSNAWEVLKLRKEAGMKSDSDLLMSSDTISAPFAYLYPDQMELEAARFVSKHTTPNDPVYIGLKSHISVYMSPTRLFWITGRNIGVKNYMLEPGLTTEEPIQRKMVADLQDKKVVWMILRSNRRGDADFARRSYKGAGFLDDYIRQNYEPVQEYGKYAVYKRRAVSSGS